MSYSSDDHENVQKDNHKNPYEVDEPIISLGPNLYQPPVAPNPSRPFPPGEFNGQHPFSNELVPIYALPSNQQSQNGLNPSLNFNYPLQQQLPLIANSTNLNNSLQTQHSNQMATTNIDVLRRQSTGGQSARRPKPLIFGKHSVEVVCPECNTLARTKVIEKFDVMMICLIILFSFFIICCILAMCSDMTKVYEHRCSHCNAFIGDSQEMNPNHNRNNQR